MFSEFLLEILTSATVSSILSGLLIWMTKSWIAERLKNSIKSEYDQKLETHKAQLKGIMDIEIEKLKSNLSIAAAERQIKFSKLHEDRAQVIAETYSLLKNVFITFNDYVKFFVPPGDKPREERKIIAVQSHNKLRDYYPRKIIYIPHTTAEKIETIDKELVSTFNKFTDQVDQTKGVGNWREWNEVTEKMSGEITQALNELEVEFRALLGDEN